jgi:hypothetical protein
MSIGLTASILNPKVIPGNAERISSYRNQEPSAMMCPVWGGQDLAGRDVCPDSFYTKRAGCHSAMDRIKVENDQRPKYANHVTISAAGISGENADYGPSITKEQAGSAALDRNSRRNQPHFGLSSAESILPSRGSRMDTSAANAYQSQDGDAQAAQARRVNQSLNIGHNSQARYGGMASHRLNPNTHVTYNSNANFTKKGGDGYVKLGHLN